MSRKISELSSKEVLAIAIQIEKENGDCLRKFADAFEGHNKEVAQKFRELAEEEDCHHEWLSQKFKRRFHGEVPAPPTADVEGLKQALAWDESEFKVFDSLKAEKIFQMALETENRARSFYQEAERTAIDKSLALLFRQLATMEDDHAGWLEERIKATA